MRIGILVLLMSVSAGLAMAGPRDATVDALEALAASAANDAVRVLVNEGDGKTLRIGDRITYRFESDQAGYLTAIHVDTHGAATLLFPRAGTTASHIDSNHAVSFPSNQDNFTLEVKPPIGRDVVYAYLTPTPLTRRDLAVSSSELVIEFEPKQATEFAVRLRDAVSSRSGNQLAANKISQQIDGHGDVQYRSLDIVNFFGTRTRSIAPPKLDLQIQFGFDSAELDAKAKQDVDEFSAALGDPRLRSMKFAVAGHTDDLGSEEHNVSLSRRRAESVRAYLVSSGGIDARRLKIEAHGEEAPLLNEDSPYARQMNRRVEFMLVRE